MPKFDLLLLGMGPDGHTASLFPGNPVLLEKTSWVAPVSNSPKPPPERVTLTLPAINAANTVAFVTTGAEKADVVEKILEKSGGNAGDEQFPAGIVRPTEGQLYWFLDGLSASKLHNKGTNSLEPLD